MKGKIMKLSPVVAAVLLAAAVLANGTASFFCLHQPKEPTCLNK